MSEARAPRESLGAMLQIEPSRRGTACARLESFWGTAAPGDLLARAVLAASALPGARTLAALHGAFLRPLAPDVELTLSAEALAPGRTRVGVHDGADPVAELTLRFGEAASGLSYQSSAPEPGLPAPESLPSEAETAAREGWAPYAVGPIEARRISEYAPVKDHEPAVWLGWLRPRIPLRDSRALHTAALAFLAEYRSHWAVERRLGAAFPRTEITLLDLSLWVHRCERWDDFWLVRTSSDVGATQHALAGVAGRCLSRREVFTRSGALVASAAWEAMLHARA